MSAFEKMDTGLIMALHAYGASGDVRHAHQADHQYHEISYRPQATETLNIMIRILGG